MPFPCANVGEKTIRSQGTTAVEVGGCCTYAYRFFPVRTTPPAPFWLASMSAVIAFPRRVPCRIFATGRKPFIFFWHCRASTCEHSSVLCTSERAPANQKCGEEENNAMLRLELSRYFLVQHRRASRHRQGFNMMYPFSSSDLTCSVAVLKNYMENAPSKVSRCIQPWPLSIFEACVAQGSAPGHFMGSWVPTV